MRVDIDKQGRLDRVNSRERETEVFHDCCEDWRLQVKSCGHADRVDNDG